MKNPGGLVKGLAEMQKRMNAAQEKLAEAQFEGAAAGGLVKATVSGKGEFKRLEISQAAMDEGPDMLSDLVVVAYNDAFSKKEAEAKKVLGGLTSGLLPLGIKLPGVG